MPKAEEACESALQAQKSMPKYEKPQESSQGK